MGWLEVEGEVVVEGRKGKESKTDLSWRPHRKAAELNFLLAAPAPPFD